MLHIILLIFSGWVYVRIILRLHFGFYGLHLPKYSDFYRDSDGGGEEEGRILVV